MLLLMPFVQLAAPVESLAPRAVRIRESVEEGELAVPVERELTVLAPELFEEDEAKAKLPLPPVMANSWIIRLLVPDGFQLV
jgi:hypothetical protein